MDTFTPDRSTHPGIGSKPVPGLTPTRTRARGDASGLVTRCAGLHASRPFRVTERKVFNVGSLVRVASMKCLQLAPLPF